MSDQGFTPGPWLLSGRTVYALNDEGFNRFSALVQDAHAPAYELDANARLMAAAPDLLQALEKVIADVPGDGFDDWHGMALDAIAKARGTPC